MDGPFPLEVDEVTRIVSGSGPGNFALGKMDKQKRFVVRFVGRDDKNVRDALLSAAKKADPTPGLIGRILGKDEGADAFKFSYAQDAQAAYGKQCRTYHQFNSKGQLENKSHPKPPNGAPGKCPVCGETQ
ncbi:hypothetical protein CKO21_16815 [Rhodovibrio salinarum]|uniref:Uncharacterized protein n=2 Tax=Rhodovibrio salinarum TaxID=1087 RepID=A0A934V1P6_9PROT|nr:hypothetical protein [Rhodovibrio salinarum]